MCGHSAGSAVLPLNGDVGNGAGRKEIYTHLTVLTGRAGTCGINHTRSSDDPARSGVGLERREHREAVGRGGKNGKRIPVGWLRIYIEQLKSDVAQDRLRKSNVDVDAVVESR